MKRDYRGLVDLSCVFISLFQAYYKPFILFLFTRLCVLSSNDADKPVHQSALLGSTDFRE